MTSAREHYVINVNQIPAGEHASRFDGHQHGAQISLFLSRNRPGT